MHGREKKREGEDGKEVLMLSQLGMRFPAKWYPTLRIYTTPSRLLASLSPRSCNRVRNEITEIFADRSAVCRSQFVPSHSLFSMNYPNSASAHLIVHSCTHARTHARTYARMLALVYIPVGSRARCRLEMEMEVCHQVNGRLVSPFSFFFPVFLFFHPGRLVSWLSSDSDALVSNTVFCRASASFSSLASSLFLGPFSDHTKDALERQRLHSNERNLVESNVSRALLGQVIDCLIYSYVVILFEQYTERKKWTEGDKDER